MENNRFVYLFQNVVVITSEHSWKSVDKRIFFWFEQKLFFSTQWNENRLNLSHAAIYTLHIMLTCQQIHTHKSMIFSAQRINGSIQPSNKWWLFNEASVIDSYIWSIIRFSPNNDIMSTQIVTHSISKIKSNLKRLLETSSWTRKFATVTPHN